MLANILDSTKNISNESEEITTLSFSWRKKEFEKLKYEIGSLSKLSFAQNTFLSAMLVLC